MHLKQLCRCCLFLSCFFLSVSTRAQLADTIVYSLHQKPKFFVTLASFGTFIDGDFANFNGIRTGLNFNQRVKFGLGYFALANRAVVSTIDINENGNSYQTNGELHIHFFSLSAEYLFSKNESPWQFTIIPFQLGIGKSGYDYISRALQSKVSTSNELILMYQPEISAQYTIMKWLGIGLTTGYRFTLLRTEKLTEHLNAPTFAVDVRIFVDELVQMLLSPPDED
jgi:hypothetical protein